MQIADVWRLRGVEAGMVARFGGSGGGDTLYCARISLRATV